MKGIHRKTVEDLLKARADNWPEAMSPISGLMVRIFRVSNLVLENAMRQIATHGLTFAAFEVLTALRSAPPPHELVPSELYNAILISSGGLTKVLYALEEKELVVRSEGKQDRRIKPVRLTSLGCELVENVMADVLGNDQRLLNGRFSEKEMDRLIQLLRKLLGIMEPFDRSEEEDNN